jgi:hypothetical protein
VRLLRLVAGPKGPSWHAVTVVLALFVLAALLRNRASTEFGTTFTLRASPDGPILVREVAEGFDVDLLTRRLDLPKEFVDLQWSGFFLLPSSCRCAFQLRGAAEAFLKIDGTLLLHREEDQREAGVRGFTSLQPGVHRLEIEYRQRSDPAFLRVSWAREGEDLHSFSPDAISLTPPLASHLALVSCLRVISRLSAGAAALLSLVMFFGWLRQPRAQGVLAWAIPALLFAYGAALRFEVLTGKTWAADQAPPLAIEAQHFIARLHPNWIVGPSDHPYLGDPWSYIRLGRAMRHFYDPSIREPLFVFATRCYLWLLGGRDIAVAFASATFSALLVLATYWLGEAAFSRAVGLVAGLCIAVEHSVIALSAEGWRDDAFAFFAVLCAVALVRLSARPSFANAILAGLAGGGACLIRITSLSFLVPAWLCLLIFQGSRRFSRWHELVLTSAFVTLACLTPFLVTCAIAFHDPFYSINAHTGFYRIAEGLPGDKPLGVFAYLFGRGHPFRLGETLLLGVTTVPFEQCWTGLDYWRPGIGSALSFLSLAGLFAFGGSAQGRLLLLILGTSLVPYAFTWDIPGGGGWRFRFHAYPFYLVASALALTGTYVVVRAAVLGKTRVRWKRGAWIGATLLIGAAGLWIGILELTRLRVREDIAYGSATIPVGIARYRLLLGSGWSSPLRLGNIPVRLAARESAVVLPLVRGRAYSLGLRMDSFFPNESTPQVVAVFLNERPCGAVTLLPKKDRIGSYALRLPPDLVQEGWNRLTFRARYALGADVEGYLPGSHHTEVGFVLWAISVVRDS